MSFMQVLVVEKGLYTLLLLACLAGMHVGYKNYKNVPGADLMLLGFLVYGTHAFLALIVAGIRGSFFGDFTLVGSLSNETAMFFIALALRLGMILIGIGLLRIGRSLKT